MKNSPHTNSLIYSTSPYLLQHANNPVNWYPWGEEAFERAMKEDKPIILSIGYSSCHWCHVMEKESFENDSVAAIMNEHFISVKVDREERPDIDQIYMDAVQAMGVSGGWPLNVFLTTDLKPFYGGTYFPAENWSQILKRIATVYQEKKEEVEISANQLVDALYASEINKYNLTSSTSPFNLEVLDKAYEKMTSRFDTIDGGIDKAPKFPMPGIWSFLIRYSTITEDKGAVEHLKFTLDRMASGGIFDQAGGGFARYSTDKEWFAPHFEKMLYDNGQLLSLYAEAYTLTKEPFYKDVIERTVEWLEKEMMNKDGGFYSALDADSEGEEGRFYVYTIEEIEKVLPEELINLTKDYYNITGSGNWEHGKNILHATMTPYQFAEKKGLPESEVKKSLTEINKLLYKYRSSRTRPALDDKILTSWNALTISGLADCYKATGDKKYLKLAVNSTEFIRNNLKEEKKLYRSYNKGKAHIDGYLEDYAHYIQALIKMYEITFEESYLDEAFKLSKYVIKQFFDPNEGLFYFTANDAEILIARKKEIFDNVIPSSNSVMGINLYLLSYYYDEASFRNIAENMMRRLSDQLPNEPVYLSTWGILYFLMSKPITEFVIVGKEYKQINKSLNNHFLPGKIIVGTKKSADYLPLLHNRTAKDGKTTLYVCYNKSCKLPVFTVEDALKQLE